MKAYQNKITKAEFVAEMKRHQEADSFMRGTYVSNRAHRGKFRGCAVGCGIESINRTKGLKIFYSDHEGLAEALGIPVWVAHLQDKIFENISFERHKSWPVEFAEAIQEGTDLNQIEVPLKIFILEDVLKVFDGKDDEWGCKRAVEKMIEALRYGDKHKIAEAAWAAEAAEAAEAVGAVRVEWDRYADKFLELARGLK